MKENKIPGSYESSIKLSHQEKIMIPPSITKGNIISYYKRIAPFMLPYMKDRPLMMHRFPEGINASSFFQKNAPLSLPSWIETVIVPKKGGTTTYMLCQNRETLIYIANLNCLTPHIWLSRYDKIDFPDKLIIDLDPSDNSFEKVRTTALLLKELFDALSLPSFVMTTGSRGVHVVIPLDRKAPFSETKAFALQCASFIEEFRPDLVTIEVSREKRSNKVFLDTARNNFTATAVAPYAIRAYSHAPVATPLHWVELENMTVKDAQFSTIDTIFKRLETIKDPWESFFKVKVSLKKAALLLEHAPALTGKYL